MRLRAAVQVCALETQEKWVRFLLYIPTFYSGLFFLTQELSTSIY